MKKLRILSGLWQKRTPGTTAAKKYRGKLKTQEYILQLEAEIKVLKGQAIEHEKTVKELRSEFEGRMDGADEVIYQLKAENVRLKNKLAS